jgi:hypothetical protein
MNKHLMWGQDLPGGARGPDSCVRRIECRLGIGVTGRLADSPVRMVDRITPCGRSNSSNCRKRARSDTQKLAATIGERRLLARVARIPTRGSAEW